MKTIIPLLILALALTINSNIQAKPYTGEEYTGQNLLDLYNNKNNDLAYGYIMGIFSVQRLNKRICNADDATADDVIDISVSYLKRFKSKNHYSAASNVSLALMTEFPCN